MANIPVSFHQLTATIISQLTGLLQVKYQAENPFATLPTTMFVAVSSIIFCFIIQIGLLLFPTSRFAAMAQHIFAYVAVSTLASALCPSGATPFIYTAFALLSTGHMFHVFGHQRATEGAGEVEGAGDGEGEGERGDAAKFEVYKRRVFGFFKNMWYGVANVFGEQPDEMLPK